MPSESPPPPWSHLLPPPPNPLPGEHPREALYRSRAQHIRSMDLPEEVTRELLRLLTEEWRSDPLMHAQDEAASPPPPASGTWPPKGT